MRNSLRLFSFPVAEPISQARSLTQNFESFFDDLVSPLNDIKLPACDVEESAERYLVSIDLPGMKKEDIKIEFKDAHLLISGERKAEKSTDENTIYRQERSFGSFYRAVSLASEVDADKIEAAYKEGVLSITIPKAEAKKGKFITVN